MKLTANELDAINATLPRGCDLQDVIGFQKLGLRWWSDDDHIHVKLLRSHKKDEELNLQELLCEFLKREVDERILKGDEDDKYVDYENVNDIVYWNGFFKYCDRFSTEQLTEVANRLGIYEWAFFDIDVDDSGQIEYNRYVVWYEINE